MSFQNIYFANRGNVLGISFVYLCIKRLKSEQYLNSFGSILVGLSIALRLIAGGTIGPWTNSQVLKSPKLITNGIYSKIRHPLYLSNILAAFGLIQFCNCLSVRQFFQLLIFIVTHHIALMQIEDRFLLQNFGEGFKKYRLKAGTICDQSIINGLKKGTLNGAIDNFQAALKNQGWNIMKIVFALITIFLLNRVPFFLKNRP